MFQIITTDELTAQGLCFHFLIAFLSDWLALFLILLDFPLEKLCPQSHTQHPFSSDDLTFQGFIDNTKFLIQQIFLGFSSGKVVPPVPYAPFIFLILTQKVKPFNNISNKKVLNQTKSDDGLLFNIQWPSFTLKIVRKYQCLMFKLTLLAELSFNQKLD